MANTEKNRKVKVKARVNTERAETAERHHPRPRDSKGNVGIAELKVTRKPSAARNRLRRRNGRRRDNRQSVPRRNPAGHSGTAAYWYEHHGQGAADAGAGGPRRAHRSAALEQGPGRGRGVFGVSLYMVGFIYLQGANRCCDKVRQMRGCF